MNFVKPRPDYLIIGTGDVNVNLDFSFYEHFRRMGISVDTCPSVSKGFIVYYKCLYLQFEACSTFNMCNEDNYNVACAILQPQISDESGYSAPAVEDPDRASHKESKTLIS